MKWKLVGMKEKNLQLIGYFYWREFYFKKLFDHVK